MYLCEFEASLVYRASSRTGFKAIQRNPVSNKKKKIGRKEGRKEGGKERRKEVR